MSWFENPPLRPLSVLGVSAVDLHVKEVHRRVAENAEEAQRVDANLSDLSGRGFTIELRVLQSQTLWLLARSAECGDEMDAWLALIAESVWTVKETATVVAPVSCALQARPGPFPAVTGVRSLPRSDPRPLYFPTLEPLHDHHISRA